MKKIAALIVFVVLLQIFVCSCSKAAAEDDFLVLGTNDIFPPFSYVDPQTLEVIGFDIELAKEIASDMGKKLKIETMDFDKLIYAIQNKEVDIALCAITITDERKLLVDFSISYFQSHQVLLVRSKDVLSFEHFGTREYEGNKKRLAAERGSTGAILASEISGSGSIIENASLELLLMELFSSNADAVMLDYQTAKAFASKYKDLRVLPTKFEPEFYGVAVHKNDNDILTSVNDTISRLINSGDYIDMVEEHINSYAQD